MSNRKILFISAIVMIFVIVGWWIIRQKNLPTISQTNPTPQASSTSDMKLYTNSEFGFEFQYPKEWTPIINSFGGPFTKFNLILEKDPKNYNPFNPSFLINVVTLEFANRSHENLKAVTSSIMISNIKGISYEYIFENTPQIDIDVPFGQYRMLLGVHKQYQSTLNQILSTFKFLK